MVFYCIIAKSIAYDYDNEELNWAERQSNGIIKPNPKFKLWVCSYI